jgi:glycosyltransferase involved in cell wall biosynthesis
MRHLLHVVHYPVFGGPHNQALRLAGPLAEHGWRTTVLLPDEQGNAETRLRACGVDVLTMPMGRLRASRRPRQHLSFASCLPGDVMRIRRVIKEREIDLVVVAGLVNPQAAIAARLAGVPVVWQIVDTRLPPALRRLFTPVVRSLADAVMTTGQAVAEQYPGLQSLGSRVVSFFPPVDCCSFRPQPELRGAVRAGWGLSDDDFVLGCVANINPQKGIEFLIQALARVRHGQPSARLVLLGEEYDTHRDYSLELRRLMARLGLREGIDVVLAGPSATVERDLQGFDAFLLGSVPLSEGTPTVIIEAMACGLPVVSTDAGAVRELVEQDVTGFVVPPLQPEAIAGASLRLLQDPELHCRMGQAARRRALECFDIGISADTHLKAFEAAMEHARRRS